ncbi:MAG: thioredoxin [Candidatus Magasanikbacteria bacterium]|nr:thioredoxin [Candidatus Magasanikbacteria bacterium]
MSKQFTDANFAEDVIKASNDKPVLVDFFATWCGPCKMQGPIVDEVAELMGDKAIVGKLNTEEAPKTASEHNVMSIPTLLVIRNGKVVETMVGMQTKETLVEIIKKHI